MRTLVFVAVLALGQSTKLTSDFRKCKLHDPDLNECLLEAINAHLPRLTKPYKEANLPNLDPLFVPDIASEANVNFTEPFTNGKLNGLTKAKIKKFEFDFDNQTILLEATFPKISITGQHNINGTIPVLPFFGAGTGKTTLNDLKVKARFLFDETKIKERSRIEIVSGSLTLNPRVVEFGFENVSSRDQAFTDQMNRLLSANWRGFYDSVEDDYTGNLLKVFTALLNKFFSKVSLEEAFD